MAFAFLIAVLSLDLFWVRTPEEIRDRDVAVALKRQNWLNLLVATGAVGAAILLLLWISSCSNATL